MRQFNSLVFDIDGTAVPDGAACVEDERLQDAFRTLPQDVYAIAATGRTAEFAMPVLSDLALRHDAAVANGASVIDPQTGTVRWEELLDLRQIATVLDICSGYDYQLALAGDPKDMNVPAQGRAPRATAGAYLLNAPEQVATQVATEIRAAVPETYVYVSKGWEDKTAVYDVNIGHANARKDVALRRLFGEYAIRPCQTVAVGDGVNDIDLFRVAGYKIAVANAAPELIALADEVVPAQEDGGILEVLRRFRS